MLGFLFLGSNVNPNGEIRRRRIRADLALAPVAAVVGRTKAWLSKVELGQIPIEHATLELINQAIIRLAALQKTVSPGRTLDDLRLPRAKNRKT